MAHVVKECNATAAKMNANMTEDINALTALCKEAVSVINTFRNRDVSGGGEDDDDSVQLHPAEIVLHHRMRSIAAATGVLLPLGADLSAQDFTTVKPGAPIRTHVGS